MILDLLKTDDPVAQRDLERIDRLLLGDIFLKGLGVRASEVPPPDDFPVVEDIVVADSMIRLQDIWDTPEPWPYQYFPGIVEWESHRIEYAPEIDKKKRDNAMNAVYRNDEYFQYCIKKIEESYERNNTVIYIIENNNNHSKKDSYVEHIITMVLEHNIQAYVSFFVETAFLGGLDRSPIFKRMLEAFETGGVPCGWLGPLPEDGGEPKTAIALLHFGKQGNSSA